MLQQTLTLVERAQSLAPNNAEYQTEVRQQQTFLLKNRLINSVDILSYGCVGEV